MNTNTITGPIQSTICDIAWELAEDGTWPTDERILRLNLIGCGVRDDDENLNFLRHRLRVEHAKRGIWGGAR